MSVHHRFDLLDFYSFLLSPGRVFPVFEDIIPKEYIHDCDCVTERKPALKWRIDEQNRLCIKYLREIYGKILQNPEYLL